MARAHFLNRHIWFAAGLIVLAVLLCIALARRPAAAGNSGGGPELPSADAMRQALGNVEALCQNLGYAK